MKRSPLVRRTPLKAKTELRTKTELQRGKPLAPISRKRIVLNASRRQVVSAMREAVAGRCARCHRSDVPVHGHERLGRAQGGDILQPDCLLCPECNGWCEDQPIVAAFTGWKLSGKWTHDPALLSTQAVDLYGNVVDFTVEPEQVA